MAVQVPKILTCSTHATDDVALFCVSCDKGICMTCMTENSHGQHQLCKPEQIVEVMKNEFKELMQKESEDKMFEKIGQQVELITRQKATVTDHQSQTSTEITKRSEELVQFIEKEKDGLLIHSKRVHDQELTLLSDQESVALRCLSYIEKHRSDPESFPHKQDMLQVMRDLKLVQAYTTPTDIKGVVTFDVSHQVTEGDVKKMFGAIKEQKLTASAKKTEQTYNHMEIVNIYKPNFNRMFSMQSNPISKISPIDMQTAFVLTNDKLCHVQFDGHRELTSKHIANGVRDITQVGKDGIYLCTEKEVKLCTLKGDIYSLENVSPNTAWSVSVTKQDNVLVCSEMKRENPYPRHGESQIEIYSYMYTLAPTAIAKETPMVVLRYSGYMYRIEQHCGKACYIGKGERGGAIQQNRINKGYTSGDKFTGNIGSNPVQSFDPRGICCDDRDQIIIADYMNNALQLLNKEWCFQKFLLREWDGLKKPTAITLYNGFLWIGQEDGSIQIRKYEL